MRYQPWETATLPRVAESRDHPQGGLWESCGHSPRSYCGRSRPPHSVHKHIGIRIGSLQCMILFMCFAFSKKKKKKRQHRDPSHAEFLRLWRSYLWMRNWTLACDPVSATVKYPSKRKLWSSLHFHHLNYSVGSLPSCFSITAPCP